MIETSELSVRVREAGPPLAESVRLQPPSAVAKTNRKPAGDPNGKRRIMLLIHGYNVSTDKARLAYDRFLSSVASEAAGFSMPVYQFMWPGDEPSKAYSALSYSLKIDVAIDAGVLLAKFLQNLRGPGGGPIEVHIVAHSLGNRVLLSMLDQIAGTPHVAICSATMMAAAVPVELVTYTQQFFKACLVPRSSLVLHSILDIVLAGPFRAGEILHGGGGFPTAIGSHGEPTANWSQHTSYNRFGHKDYWIKPGPPGQVAELLGYARPRKTASSEFLPRQTAVWRLQSPDPFGWL